MSSHTLSGLDWLKIHAINVAGLKKRDSLDERVKYANEILEDILDSAHNPLNGAGWWKKGDKPWETLAACKEISNALSSSSPESFLSRLPVHQDGSCNRCPMIKYEFPTIWVHVLPIESS